MNTNTTMLAAGVQFPESLRWYADKLWFSDYATQRIMNVDLTGHVQTVVELPDLPTALAWTHNGQLLIVSADQRRLLRMESDGVVKVADLSDLVAHACNELVVDVRGNAYVGNLGFDFGTPTADAQVGSIVLVTPDGEAHIVADRLAFPNGMVITPDGQTLIVAESYAARLTAFHIEPDGSLSHRRVWAQFDESLSFEQGRFTPDGICLDADGAVWVAALNEVLRVQEGAAVTHHISLDSFALACMLGGRERRTLFIATTTDLNPADSNATGRIETLEVSVPGAGLALGTRTTPQ